MLKEIDKINFLNGKFSKFPNASYYHDNLEVLQSYVGKAYEKIS